MHSTWIAPKSPETNLLRQLRQDLEGVIFAVSGELLREAAHMPAERAFPVPVGCSREARATGWFARNGTTRRERNKHLTMI